MLQVSLSNSSVDRFCQCPLSFYHAYVNKPKPRQEGVVDFYGNYGSLIHLLVEIYPRVNKYRDFPWSEEAARPSSTVFDTELMKAQNKAMTYSSIDVSELMSIYDEIFPLINIPPERSTEYYDQGISFINQIPDMEWDNVVGLEQNFSFSLRKDMPEVRGVIDKIERDEKGLIVTDYKTSKPYSANASIQKNQLPMYGMACFFMYGEMPYKYRYHFTRYDKIVEVEIPIERITQVKNAIIFNYMQMKAFNDNGKFPARFSKFYCNHFCGYSRLCESFQQFNIEAEARGSSDVGLVFNEF